MRVDYGAVALIPRGDFNSATQYKVNDVVSYNGSSFVVKTQPPIGTLPTNATYFSVMASGASPATSQTVGTVKPDNTSTNVANDGTLSVGKNITDALTVNLLNPVLQSRTLDGVTIVKNADNSYTISGTNTSENTVTAYLALIASIGFENGKTYRVLGCPSNTPAGVYIRVGTQVKENGEGANFSYPVQSGQQIFISIAAGTVIETPITIKPMITTNLNATYDDFVQYTGSSGKLGDDYKALNDKVTTVQEQIATANGNIAQNTTDIATNTTAISALNTGLTKKVESYTDDISHKLGHVVYNTNSKSIIFHDTEDDLWRSAYDSKLVNRDGLNITNISSKANLRDAYASQFGNVVQLSIVFDVNQSIADGEILLNVGNLRPILYAFSTPMNGSRVYNHLALNSDGTLRAWGNLATGTFFSASFTYVI